MLKFIGAGLPLAVRAAGHSVGEEDRGCPVPDISSSTQTHCRTQPSPLMKLVALSGKHVYEKKNCERAERRVRGVGGEM